MTDAKRASSEIDLLPLRDRSENSIASVSAELSGSGSLQFSKGMSKILTRIPQEITYPRSSLVEGDPDLAHVFTNSNPNQKLADVISFHFPGASGQWDEERCGPQFDGYAGSALRAGVGKAIIVDWSFTHEEAQPLPPKRGQVTPKRQPYVQEIEDVVKMIQLSKAKRVYLSGRSYGASVILRSLPFVRQLNVDIVGVDLKVPAITNPKTAPYYANLLKDTPILITQGDKDPNTDVSVTNSLYKLASGPKAIVTLTDIRSVTGKSFNHHLKSPELKFVTAAATETFINTIS